jgi:hypothetical protein
MNQTRLAARVRYPFLMCSGKVMASFTISPPGRVPLFTLPRDVLRV